MFSHQRKHTSFLLTLQYIYRLQSVWKATEHVVECDTVESLAKPSQHLPIRTILGFTPDMTEAREGWKYKAADWKAFRGSLKAEINQHDGYPAYHPVCYTARYPAPIKPERKTRLERKLKSIMR